MNKLPKNKTLKLKSEEWQKIQDKAIQAQTLIDSPLLQEYLNLSKERITSAIVGNVIKKRKDYEYDKDGFIKTVFEKEKTSIIDELSGIYTFIEELESYLQITISEPDKIKKDQDAGYVTIED